MIIHVPKEHKIMTVMNVGDGHNFMRYAILEDGTSSCCIYTTLEDRKIGIFANGEYPIPEDVNLDFPDLLIHADSVEGLDVFIAMLTNMRDDMKEAANG